MSLVGKTKIMSVLVLTAGIGLFMLFKPSKSAGSGDTFEYNADLALGVGLIVAALFMDGVYGPYQNKITSEVKKETGEELSPYHLMFNMNFYQGVFSLVLVSTRHEISRTCPLSLNLAVHTTAQRRVSADEALRLLVNVT